MCIRDRPTGLDGIPEPMERPDPRISAPSEDELFGAAHADELVKHDVRRQSDQGQILAALPDDLVAGRDGDQVREAFHGHTVPIVDQVLDRLSQALDLRHTFSRVR